MINLLQNLASKNCHLKLICNPISFSQVHNVSDVITINSIFNCFSTILFKAKNAENVLKNFHKNLIKPKGKFLKFSENLASKTGRFPTLQSENFSKI